MNGAFDAFQKILKQGGVQGLWKGSVPNVYRAALVNLGDLTTYDSAKRFIINNVGIPDSHLTHTLSRYVDSLSATFIIQIYVICISNFNIEKKIFWFFATISFF